MGQPEVILLIAVSAALAAWAIAQLVMSHFSTDKNKIQQRLSNNWRPDIASSLNKPVTISLEMKEMPAFLARSAYMQRLYRKLVQAYPDAKLTTFLSICAGVGLGCGVLVIAPAENILDRRLQFIAHHLQAGTQAVPRPQNPRQKIQRLGKLIVQCSLAAGPLGVEEQDRHVHAAQQREQPARE